VGKIAEKAVCRINKHALLQTVFWRFYFFVTWFLLSLVKVCFIRGSQFPFCLR